MPAPDVLYVGGEMGIEASLVTRAGVRFAAVPAGGLHGLAPQRAARNLVRLLQGCRATYRLARQERPAALLVTGGHTSVPVALACWALRVPIMVYLPDIEPGLAVRLISRLATRVAVTVPDSQEFFPARKVTVTGYPVRAAFGSVDRATARASLGFTDVEPVVLVLGGSTGARGINRALGAVLEEALDLVQVVHVSGERDWEWVSERKEVLPEALKPRYRIAPYLHTDQLGVAFAAADLAVCRAGASTLGELPYFGLPAVVVPYPHAWRYQRTNADWLTERGAAIRLDEERLADELVPMLRNLIMDRGRLRTMRECMRSLAQPDAACRLAAELRALAG
jgi:UDP-N-acetylglucosamine--N-acetylmuramyl-(pentapeptide) pyrophosphoryl-undecaprenol N-acetylglucosamine transferase